MPTDHSSNDYRIVITKHERTLSLLSGPRLHRLYSITHGRNAVADKAIEGDFATPLGEFYVCAKNPRSKFFLSLCISYPNAEDAQRGLAANLLSTQEYARILEATRLRKIPPQHTRLGGEIYIHGTAVNNDTAMTATAKDWTSGCIAMDNQSMRELYDYAVIGTPVRIEP